MNIKLTSDSGKKIFYRVYSPNGKTRKLLARGEFIGSTEINLPDCGEIIVRVRPKRGIRSFPAVLKTAVLNLFCCDARHPTQLNYNYEDYNVFHEIRLINCDNESLDIIYNLSPVSENAAGYIFHGVYREYLICQNHPYKAETKSAKKASVILDVISGAVLLGLIVGIAFLIGILLRTC